MNTLACIHFYTPWEEFILNSSGYVTIAISLVLIYPFYLILISKSTSKTLTLWFVLILIVLLVCIIYSLVWFELWNEVIKPIVDNGFDKLLQDMGLKDINPRNTNFYEC